MFGLSVVARRVLVSMMVVGVVAGAAGCGGSGGSAVIVRFGADRITKATLAHWIPIQAVLERELVPQEPPAAGEVPDPPRYTACIAFVKDGPPRAGKDGVKPNATEARLECQHNYEHIRKHMLQLLVSYQWTEAQARTLGITITPKELQQTWKRDKLEIFGPERVFQKYLKATGETYTDELKIVRFNMQSSKIQEKLLHERGTQGLRTYLHQAGNKLKAQTNCSPEYIIPNCKQYNGPLES